MKKFRQILIIAASTLIVGQLVAIIRNNNFSFELSLGSYLSILSMILLIISVILSSQHEKKKTRI